MVNQHFFKVVSTEAPVLLQVERQISRDNLSATVGHPAC
jgi:hypothetical protein